MLNTNSYVETAIAVPFKIDVNGSVKVSTTQKAIWNDRVHSVVATSLNERVMKPDFGTNLNSALWAGETAIKRGIETTISAAFGKWLPYLKLVDVQVGDLTTNNEMYVNIRYELPNNASTSTIIGLVGLNANNIPIQENK